ncbi:uncharacterized protein G2W53_032119 [Senna tora]|uniref:Uncharacterized protein n=1 Tax=Senna tora TaxID=362788 RepID=A0A834W7E2_9FABA|nr:uncharacterized protein G2W53_032119 [Senna tora]
MGVVSLERGIGSNATSMGASKMDG